MAYTIKTPAYINDFKCIGGKCELHCCQNWEIDWLEAEVDKLKNAECSDTLRKIVDKSFEETRKGVFRIILGDDGDCPFHDKNDRLCMIQKELGEEYLSYTCRSYPATGTINDRTVLKYRVLSCPAVYDLITASQNACDVYVNSDRPDTYSEIGYFTDSVAQVKENPILKYRNQLFDFFYGLLSNKKTDIKTSVILGILAASKLDEFAKKDHTRIPEVIKALTPQMTNPATVSSVKNITPNYSVKLPIVQNLTASLSIDEQLKGFMSQIKTYDSDDTLQIDPSQYEEYVKKFEKCFPQDFVIKNIIRSLYMDIQMPFNDKKGDIFGNYVYFAVVAATVEYLGACVAANYDDENTIREKFRLAVCTLSKKACHADVSQKNVLTYLKNINCYSSAYVSIAVK